MYDIYESTLQLLASDSAMSEIQREMRLSLAAWMTLRGRENPESEQQFMSEAAAYLDARYPGKGDLLHKLVTVEEADERETVVRLRIHGGDWHREYEAIGASYSADEKQIAQLRETLMRSETLRRLIGIQITPESPLRIRVTKTAPRMVRVHYFEDLGALLCLGCKIALDGTIPESEIPDFLTVFRALADSSRLEIVQMLMNESLTVSQISSRLGLTASTVIYHLKTLTEAGLVAPSSVTKSGKGTLYRCDQESMRRMARFVTARLGG